MKGYKPYDATLEDYAGRWADRLEKHLHTARKYASAYCARHPENPILARIHTLLAHKKKYVRPTHDLLCGCRRCTPRLGTLLLAIKLEPMLTIFFMSRLRTKIKH